MTTIPPPTLDTLYETGDPLLRAERLTILAGAHVQAGRAAEARLLQLLADTETMLITPHADPSTADDPAWDDNDWWRLASTVDRLERADIIRTLWRDWALANIGDGADILLEVALTEQAVAHATADIDYRRLEAELANHLAAAAVREDDAEQPDVPELEAIHVVDDPVQGEPRRPLRPQRWAAPVACVAAAALAAFVAAPGTDASIRFVSAVALFLLVIGTTAVLVFRGGWR